MFPTNPFPHLTSTIQVFQSSNSFLDHQKHDHHWINNHNPYDLVEPQVSLEHYNECNHLFWSEIKKEKPSKKDHHSKIHTAKGPRDRRVRLSIDVAKKFFFLQDLLEVDKASETLDWLFNKSKISIDELIKRKKETSSSTVVTDQSEVIFLETDEQDKGRNKKCGERKRKKITQKYKSGFNQLRADARARARARTKEKKLNIKMLDVHCCSSDLTLQTSFWSSIESQNDYADKISTVYNYENNLVVSNDSSSKFTGLPKFADLHQQRGDCATI